MYHHEFGVSHTIVRPHIVNIIMWMYIFRKINLMESERPQYYIIYVKMQIILQSFMIITIIITKHSYYEKKGDNNELFKHYRKQTVRVHQNPLHKSIIRPPQWSRKSAMYISWTLAWRSRLGELFMILKDEAFAIWLRHGRHITIV